MGRGLFLTFEGTEGSGKSTQVRLLADRFTAAGHVVRVTREPGGTALGEAVRGLLLSDECANADPRTEALLHTAARAEHVARLIRPELERGTHVISDRFYDSTLAYQGGGSGLPIDELWELQHFAVGDCQPDQRILLVTGVEEGLRRRFADRSPVNRIDRVELDFHMRVAATFESLASQDPAHWIVIDGNQSKDLVLEEVVDQINFRFPELGLA